MASSQPKDPHEEWNKTTEEINALSDSELHETRPNRWRGNPSTWKGWTNNDRKTWTSLDNLRRQDLSVHLYNAYGLKKRFRAGPEYGEEEDVDRNWDPNKLWTAWPVGADEVPDDDLLPRTVDEDDKFTFRRQDPETTHFAGTNLEGEVSALILRAAKEKFLRREYLHPTKERSTETSASLQEHDQQHGGHLMQSIEQDSQHLATSGIDTGHETNDTNATAPVARRSKSTVEPHFTPVLSADDDRNYALTRPAARKVMQNLDNTLMVLHNARLAGLKDLDESGHEDENEDMETKEEEQEENAVERARKRASSTLSEPDEPQRNRTGRPKKYIRQEGETEQEFLIRVAKARKQRKPRFGPDGELLDTKPKPRGRPRSRGRSRSASTSRSSSTSSSVRDRQVARMSRWGVRDWKAVLGAAALASFPPEVIARATQRCATLFQEEMSMHTLPEQPVTSDKPAVRTALYRPGMPLPSSSDEESSDEQQKETAQWRTISRQPSVFTTVSPEPAVSTPTPRKKARTDSRSSRPATPGIYGAGPKNPCPYPDCPRHKEAFTRRNNLTRHIQVVHGGITPQTDDEGGGNERDHHQRTTIDPSSAGETSPEPTQKSAAVRTPSRRSGTPAPPGSGAGTGGGKRSHLCSYPDCPRAINGFPRKTNLTRHIKLVHSGPRENDDEDGGDVDSMDEMLGGAHRDWFLQPIKIRRGWRGPDVSQRQKRGRKRRRDDEESVDLD
ncbi:hypothetical protein QBC35DRAFT_486278 [Podospora australis]|uniref:C2H2-type domain-containing protein n=1 Tax=Podospora australis TaxID=1536484 RepID=A0AAN6X0U2_9PEZI|nr:hypothetical protein QBC35DRAFT_486278 [Podospora australis]